MMMGDVICFGLKYLACLGLNDSFDMHYPAQTRTLWNQISRQVVER